MAVVPDWMTYNGLEFNSLRVHSFTASNLLVLRPPVAPQV